MDEEELEDRLVDRTKELLDNELSDVDTGNSKPEMKHKRNKLDEKVERDSTSKIPFLWDPREIEYFQKNRSKMSNGDLKEFLQKDSEFQEKVGDIDDWKPFSRWEERLLVQKHSVKSPEELAEQMDREKEKIEVKMHMLGLKIE